MSAAYYLDQYVKSTGHDVETTVYERNLPGLNGRHTAWIGPWSVQNGPDTLPTVESGAHIFTTNDRIMMQMVEVFNMSRSITPARWGKDARLERNTNGYEDDRLHRIGIWDSNKFIVNQDSEDSYLDQWWAEPLLRSRYHDAPAKLVELLEQRDQNLTKFYDAPIFPFKKYSSAMIESGLNYSVSSSAADYFAASGIVPSFIGEIVASYAQSTYGKAANPLNRLGGHGLAALSSLATRGSMRGSVPNKVPDCNKEPPGECDLRMPTVLDELLVRQMGKGLGGIEITTEVRNVKWLDNGSWLLKVYDMWQVESTAVYDEVILAAPYWSSEVVFDPPLLNVPYQRYEPLYATVLTTPHLLSPSFFGLEHDQQVPDEILTRKEDGGERNAEQDTERAFFRIIRRGTILSAPSNYTQRENLYEILTPDQIRPSFLRNLFDIPEVEPPPPDDRPHDCDKDIDRFWNISCKDVSWILTGEQSEMKYPVFEPFASAEELDKRAPIKLSDGLWYTSGMELIESRMEAMMLSGKNVARLMVDEWLAAAA